MPEPTVPLSRWQKFTLWFSANRTRIGGLLTSVATFLVMIDDHPLFSAGADILLHAAALILGGTGIGVAAAGMFKDDQFHKERKEVAEAQASGLPIMRSGRRADDSHEPFILHFCPGDTTNASRSLRPGEICPSCGFPSKKGAQGQPDKKG